MTPEPREFVRRPLSLRPVERTPYRRGSRTRPWRRPRAGVLVAVGMGGGLGTMARYGIAQAMAPADAAGVPWATFLTNVTGSFVLGLVLTLLLERVAPTRYVRPFVATGFLGAYTTYSTFAVETHALLRQGRFIVAAAYAIATFVIGLVAVWGGMLVARALPHPFRGGRGGSS